MGELADRIIGITPWAESDGYWFDASPGRRLRCFARLVKARQDGTVWFADSYPLWAGDISYATLLSVCEVTLPEPFANLALATSNYRGPLTAIPDSTDPRSHVLSPWRNVALQDLADEIQEDVSDACRTSTDPHAYYPGVDDGSIEPVPDEHVRLVIWAMQRQLNNDRRQGAPVYGGQTLEMPSIGTRPAFPLDTLAWPVQRALVERRRLRHQQWGIGRGQWEQNTWSLWDVPLDEDYVPRRALRGRGRGG